MRRLAIVSVILCFGLARPARADLASSIYGDVQDIVQELIETEVTTNVVGRLKAKSPSLGFYMNGTLERLASPYWGSLGRTLKQDLTVMIADFVYWHMTVGGGDGDIVKSARRFFDCAVGTAPNQEKPGCKRLLDAVTSERRPLLEVECRRNKPDPNQRISCDVGLAIRAALEGRKEVRHHITDALSNIVLLELGDDRQLLETAQSILLRWLEPKTSIPVALFEVLGSADIRSRLTDTELERLCKSTPVGTMRDFLNNPLANFGWICFALNSPDTRQALEFGIQIRGPGAAKISVDPKKPRDVIRNEGQLKSFLDYSKLEGMVARFDNDNLTEEAAFRAILDLALQDCGAETSKTETRGENDDKRSCPEIGAGGWVSIFFMGWNYSADVGANGALVIKNGPKLATQLGRFARALKRIHELKKDMPSALNKYLFVASTDASARTPETMAKVMKAIRAVSRMMQLVNELRARWYLWQTDAKSGIDDLDIVELLQVARDTLGTDAERVPALAFLHNKLGNLKHDVKDKVATVEKGIETGRAAAATLDIGDWFRYVVRADFRSLAMESLRAALDLRLNDQTRAAETFFMTLTSYLLDAGDEGVGETIARSAFKASAKELLLSSSTQGVPRVADRTRVNLFPRLGMRLAFNDSYGVADGNARRTTLAVDWPTAMYAFTDYAGVELSILDLAAPLAELSLRSPGTYKNQSTVALDIIRPRVGVYIAVPSLSKRLALDVGVGMRLLQAERTSLPEEMLRIEYSTKASFFADLGVEFIF